MRLPNLMPVRRGDRTYWYYRTKGHPLTALPDLPHDDPEFLHAYATARAAAPAATRHRKAAPGSLAAIATAVRAGVAWRGYSDGYRKLMSDHLDAITDGAEDALVGDLRRRHIEDDLAPLTPAVARNRLKAWRLIVKQAMRAELIADDKDPTARVRPAKMPKGAGIDGLTDDEIDRFRGRWPIGTLARARFELLLWTAAAVQDAVRLGPQMVDRDGILSYRRAKTNVSAHIPWTAPLPAFATSWAAERAQTHAALAPFAGHALFLPTRAGAMRSEKAIVNDVRADMRAAGVKKSAHSLRVTRSRLLHESGATQHQAKAWLAHLTDVEASHYGREADRRRAVMGTEQEENVANPARKGEKRRK